MKKLLISFCLAFVVSYAMADSERYIRKKTCIDKETGDFADFDKCDGSQDWRYKTVVTCHDKEADYREVDTDFCTQEM